jgi:hypothetical protein
MVSVNYRFAVCNVVSLQNPLGKLMQCLALTPAVQMRIKPAKCK